MKLKVEKREVFWKKTKTLIKENLIPGVIYSKHLKKNIHVMFNRIEFIKLYAQAWESTPINIEWAAKQLAMIHTLQIHPVTSQVIHVDFLAVKSDEKIEAEIPLVFVWTAPVETQKLWKIERLKDSVLVEAFPNDLPHNIEIDLSKVETVNDLIFVKDVVLDKKVEMLDNPELPILTIVSLEDLGEEPEETKEEATSENKE